MALGVWLGCFTLLHAQQPAWFRFGEETFAGVEIYDVIQDQSLNYWFATNEGLFVYDHNEFEKVECPGAKSQSFFNLVQGTNGDLYCHNLNRQVFVLRQKKASLFYELRPDEFHVDISLCITAEGQVLIGAAKFILLSPAGEVLKKADLNGRSAGAPFPLGDGSLIYLISGRDSVLVFRQGNFSRQKLNSGTSLLPLELFTFFRIGQEEYAVEVKGHKFYKFQSSTFSLTPAEAGGLFDRSKSMRIYETGGEIWIAGSLPGVILWKGGAAQASPGIFFENYFISNVYRDREGNVLLCTFDKGVLVVPDMEIQDVIHTFSDDPVSALLPDSAMGLLLGTVRGRLMQYEEGRFTVLSQSGTNAIQAMYSDVGSDYVVFDDGSIRAFDRRRKQFIPLLEASLKDVIFVSPNEMLLGTNRGIVRCTLQAGKKPLLQNVEGVIDRVFSLAMDRQRGIVYASVSEGLICLLPDGVTKRILHQGKNIFPLDLAFGEGTLYAQMHDNRILRIRGENVFSEVSLSLPGEDEMFSGIRFHDHALLIKTNSGLYRADTLGRQIKPLHSIFGFASQHIADYAPDGNAVWVSHARGVQKIDLSYHPVQPPVPAVRIHRVKVNDEERNAAGPLNLGSDQRKIQFTFSTPSLRNRETIRYYYRLQGQETEWNLCPHPSNQATYNALAPGHYVLEYRAVNAGSSGPVYTIAFTIARPLFARPWFIAGMAALFVIAVYVIYQRQIRVQRRKARMESELNESKLTAIKSQMNPHFIFNSLNSIQDLVLKGDVENSYTYITAFSNLVRSTLDYSGKDFIDFEQELKLIELYLSLEKLRFKKEFTYAIDTGNVEDILVPPLLIQPFIENALVHGLLHKEGGKELNISFHLQGEILTCVIEDNGIGREQARKIKMRQRGSPDSFSGEAIKKRFAILKSQHAGELGFRVDDLMRGGLAAGTRVTLVIPVKQKF